MSESDEPSPVAGITTLKCPLPMNGDGERAGSSLARRKVESLRAVCAVRGSRAGASDADTNRNVRAASEAL
jgi:hypothetical protein